MALFLNMGGPSSELEAAGKRKFVTEKELKASLSSQTITLQEMRIVHQRLIELLEFYDKVIKSINMNKKMVEKKPELSYDQKKAQYYNSMNRELEQAKREQTKFRNYMKSVKETISKMENK